MTALVVLSTVSGGWHDVTQHVSSWANTIADRGGAWVIFVLILACAGLVGFAVMSIVARPSRQLASVVEPYRLRQTSDPTLGNSSSGSEVVTLPVLQRASRALTSILERGGWRPAMERKLARSGLPLGVGEYTLISIVAGVVLLALGIYADRLVGLLVALVLAVLLPVGLVEGLAEQRSRKFNAQLPDVLQVLAGTLRAGFSLTQGLDAVVDDVRAPMDRELRRALVGARLGLPIEDSLTEMGERIDSPDFSWTVMAIRIQREVGGNLAEILDTVARTMLERGRLRREIRTLTAEGRISALILGALPILIGLFIFVVNRSYLDQLFQSTPGEVALFGGIALELFGAWWMYKTIQIEI